MYCCHKQENDTFARSNRRALRNIRAIRGSTGTDEVADRPVRSTRAYVVVCAGEQVVTQPWLGYEKRCFCETTYMHYLRTKASRLEVIFVQWSVSILGAPLSWCLHALMPGSKSFRQIKQKKIKSINRNMP